MGLATVPILIPAESFWPLCCAVMWFYVTIKILFNVTEVARLWAVDERMSVLCPVLGNGKHKWQRGWHSAFASSARLCSHSGEQPDAAIFELVAHLLQSFPWRLLNVNSGPQHVVEGGQEVVTYVQGKLLNGLHLSGQDIVVIKGKVGGATVKNIWNYRCIYILHQHNIREHCVCVSYLTPLSLARAWTVFFMVSVGIMSELSPCK